MSEPVWLDPDFVLALHGRLLADHGGAPGVRDAALLEAALARPRQVYSYGAGDLAALAAAYAAGLIGNNPFIDGNKRIGFMAAYVFLARNGVRLDAPEAEAAHTVRNLAVGELNEDRFAAWLRDRAR